MNTTVIPQHVLDAANVTDVTQLILLERECFHPDSLIRVSWFTGNGEMINLKRCALWKRELFGWAEVKP